MSVGDILLLLLLALLLGWAVRRTYKNHKEGRTCDGSSCGGCQGCSRGRGEKLK